MKKKTWLSYLLIITLIILVVYGGKHIFDGYKHFKYYTIINPFIFEIIFYVILGILLGLDYFIQEIKRSGKWRINIAKLVLLGIPSIYFSFAYFLYFALGRFLPYVFIYPLAILIRNTPNITPVFQMLLGYTLITIFIKNEHIK